MASSIPKEVKKETIDLWIAETWKTALFTSASNVMTQSVYTTCTSEVASGSGYTTGGKTLTGKVAIADGETWAIDADDPVWTGATFTARYAASYNTATGKIRIRHDLGGDKVASSSTFTVVWNVGGLEKNV